ncbi:MULTISPECIES: P-loop NTPase [Bacillus cereus group]|uniref:Iron-sulfur cluster carrier protein n=1 Tax=Bacillus cytotoxicus (strain DSM 22905 / CIP 110041 / 391-98 / NVH 391-98) TaxID=315749 RepID=A7GK73_BACCN|nr:MULTISPECIES: P-loop NTPase [Bacillus cereus group]ABS20531.1 protein of unknown function DUF59 [Bacillus cytotoxicus NVH 391-98]AWC43276.1 ATP-binding protein [Bacillus cytotoxicus]MDH2865593.1 Mrp/NBP35 family ATP-binding protein [Bacillus cytotoxicus]MDH2882530.1 Mrp/NBP35 family ATP-binding protein [Bacillus cytotoxicus]MDH2885608.1 Mrp/NBP35 family ATP-binding protein [Bacillus cytotoxicus]
MGKIKKIYVVSSGKGGVGKSTIASRLAFLLNKQRFKVGLLDLDIHGPSITNIFNISTPPLVKEGKMLPYQNNGLKIVSMGMFVEKNKAFIWKGVILKGIIKQLLNDVEWEELDYLIIDTPPGTGDILINLIQEIKIDGVIMVTTPQAMSKADVRRSLNMIKQLNIPITSLVENMSSFTCPHCNEKISIFKHDDSNMLSEYCIDKHIVLPFELNYNDSLFEDIEWNIEKELSEVVKIL